MNEKAHCVFYGIEDPIPILFWDPLEFTMAVCFFGFGIVTDLWVFGAALGTAVLVGSRYMRRGAKKGSVQHLLWSVGLQLDACLNKFFKPSWCNDFTE